MKKAGIYKIENSINGRVYIGSSINISRRLSDHARALDRNIHDNKHLQHSWNKYGVEVFIFTEIELCEPSMLIEREQHYIDILNACGCGYNMCPIAGNTLGKPLPAEARRKIGDKKRGVKTGPCTEERRQNIAKAHLGKKQTEEHNRKAKEARWVNEWHHTDESKKKISESTKGKAKPDGMGKKVSIALSGKRKSPEHCLHLSEAKKGKPGKLGRPCSLETRKKMSEALKGNIPWNKGLKLINRKAP